MTTLLFSRRHLLKALGLAAAGAPMSALAQGRCMTTFGSPSCVTKDIAPVFAATGWKTVALDHVTFNMADYRKEAAFYVALMGWTLRSDDGAQAVLDMGPWSSAVFKKGNGSTTVESFSFVVAPWDTKKIESELRTRNLSPAADHDGKGFESFWVKDPDGWPVQICNGNGLAKARKTAARATLASPAPFASTGWKTVWLDHFSFNVTDYKKSASFYMNLLGWAPTYDEGSQH